MRVDDYTEEEI